MTSTEQHASWSFSPIVFFLFHSRFAKKLAFIASLETLVGSILLPRNLWSRSIGPMCLFVRSSVCPSICIVSKIAIHSIVQTTPHNTSRNLVIWREKSRWNYIVVNPNEGAKCRWGMWKLATFDKWPYRGNGTIRYTCAWRVSTKVTLYQMTTCWWPWLTPKPMGHKYIALYGRAYEFDVVLMCLSVFIFSVFACACFILLSDSLTQL